MILESVEEQLELTFTYLPTCFSRLAFLASVRDSYTGRYLHEGWATRSSVEEVHEILWRSHKDVFNLVLKMPLTWLETESYRDMIPEGVSPVSRAFFLSQIKTGLKVLLASPEWSLMEARSASLHPLLALPPRHHLEN